jgi:hypothetical protein
MRKHTQRRELTGAQASVGLVVVLVVMAGMARRGSAQGVLWGLGGAVGLVLGVIVGLWRAYLDDRPSRNAEGRETRGAREDE